MKDRNSSLRTLILTVTAALFVVLFIALVAFFASREQNSTKITLPAADSELHEPEREDDFATGFVAVTRENAAKVVASLSRPAFYQQKLSRRTVSSTGAAVSTVQIWVQNGITKLIVSEAGQVRHILTNGTSAYIWYADALQQVRHLVLPAGVSADDLSGVLTYESILSLPQQAITEAEYQQLPELDDIPSLFVAAKETDGTVTRFWVDLSSGLLCKAECLQNGTAAYTLQQTGFELLDESDAALAAQMLLPGGVLPSFSTEEEQTPPVSPEE